MSLDQSITQVRSSSRLLVRELNFLKGSFNDTGFSYSQCHILFELDKHKILNLKELSDILRLDKSTTSRVIKRLIDKGLVKIDRHDNDQRQKLYSLTNNGKEATKCNNQLASMQVENALALLNQEEQALVKKGLQLYAKTLSQLRKQQAFTIRPIEAKDDLQVAKIIRTTIMEYGANGEGSSIHDPEVDHMSQAYNSDRAAFFVICKGEQVLGCGGIAPLKGEEARICELQKMYFLPELRGKGLGKKLLRLCLNTAREIGFKQCYLETIEEMWQANALYKKMGFTQLDHQIGCTGHSACNTTYIKEL